MQPPLFMYVVLRFRVHGTKVNSLRAGALHARDPLSTYFRNLWLSSPVTLARGNQARSLFCDHSHGHKAAFAAASWSA